MFTRRPQAVALTPDLPEPGSVVTRDQLGFPVVLTRDEDDVVHGFANVCAHRGSQVVPDGRDCTRGLTCRYHAWSYDLAGTLVGVPDRSSFPGVELGGPGLREFPTSEDHGVIWLIPDLSADPATPIVPQLGAIADDLEHFDIAGHRYWRSHRIDLAFDWKLVIDTFFEPYHFASLHRNTVAPIFTPNLCWADRAGDHVREVLPRRSIVDAHRCERTGHQPLPRTARRGHRPFGRAGGSSVRMRQHETDPRSRQSQLALGHDEVGDERSRVVVHRRLDVRVSLQRDRDVCVAETLLDHTGMDAIGERDRRPCVTKAVGREVRHLVLADAPLEGLVHALGMERSAVRLAEDVVLIDEAGTDEESLLEHPASVFAKDTHGVRVEGDRPTAGGRLRLSGDEFPLDRSERLSDADTRSSEVDVGPMKSEGLAAPQPSRREEGPHRIERVVGGAARSEEPSKRLGVPRLDLSHLCRAAWRVGSVGGIAG